MKTEKKYPMTPGRVAAMALIGVGSLFIMFKLASGFMSGNSSSASAESDYTALVATGRMTDMREEPEVVPQAEIKLSNDARELLQLSRNTMLNRARERSAEAESALKVAQDKLKAPIKTLELQPSFAGGFPGLPVESISSAPIKQPSVFEQIYVVAVTRTGNISRAIIKRNGGLVSVVVGDRIAGSIDVTEVGSNFVKLRKNKEERTIFVASGRSAP
jgi:type IV pilus biogenesis protein PilP